MYSSMVKSFGVKETFRTVLQEKAPLFELPAPLLILGHYYKKCKGKKISQHSTIKSIEFLKKYKNVNKK